MIHQSLKELAESLQQKLFSLKDELPGESQIRAVIESQLRKLNLVTREEFDAQCAVLLRTREKVEALEKQLAELEQQIKD